jgi:hypothetical protein
VSLPKRGAFLLLLPVIRVQVKKRTLSIRQNNSSQHVSLLIGFRNTFVVHNCHLFDCTELITRYSQMWNSGTKKTF